MSENKVINAGIIGCGSIGRIHAECISRIDGIQIVAYCDLFEENAKIFLQEFGGSYATGNAEDIFSDSSIDAVYVTTLNDTHAEYCVKAMEAGKHVMVEKPLALRLEDCIRIGETVKKTGKKFMTAFKLRYYDMLIKAKELIPKPIIITMQMMDDRWPNEIWANDLQKGGGNVICQGCHSADIIRFMTDADPLEVYAFGGNYYQKTGVVDNVCVVYKLNNGTVGNLVQGDCCCPPEVGKFFMQLFAEGKSVTLVDRFTKLIYKETGRDAQVFHGSESGFFEENRAFVKCILEDEPSPIDYSDGLYATLMILQAIKSLSSGKPEPLFEMIEGFSQ